MSTRGDATRHQLIEAAEMLWAERGIRAVSLREIALQAGQHNNSALQYHFGTRDTLLQVVADRHMSALKERTARCHAALPDREEDSSFRDLVGVLVRPSVEYLAEGPSARYWVRIAAQILSAPSHTNDRSVALAAPAAIDAGTRLAARMTPDFGFDLAVDRLRMATEAAAHLTAARARLEGSSRPARPVIDRSVYLELLVDVITASLSGPPSAALTTALANRM